MRATETSSKHKPWQDSWHDEDIHMTMNFQQLQEETGWSSTYDRCS